MSLESKLLHPRYHPGYHPRIPAQPMSLSRLGPSSGRPRPREEWGLQVVLAGGAEGSFLCSLSSRFSGRGGGVGSLPRAWRRVGVPGAAGAKKIVRLHRFFLHQISLESKLNGRQKVKGGNGSISASISTSLIASVIASLITLNLGVG